MIKQQTIAKDHEDVPYLLHCNLKITPEFAIKFKEHCTFICTDNKHKNSVGERDTPLSTLPREKRVLVCAGKYF